MLCYDVLDLVGQEVSLCRGVYQNKKRYDSVVASMRDMFRRTYNLRRSVVVGCDVARCSDDQCSADHWDTFISDFKVRMYELYLIGKIRRHQQGHGAVINGDVFYHQLSRGWGWGYKLNVEDDWYTPESEEIRLEIYGPWENTYEGFMEMKY
jgi:hypothetical protein